MIRLKKKLLIEHTLNVEREREITMMKGKGKGKLRLNKGKLITRVAMLVVILLMARMGVSFAKYPEQYLTTWKYQLENDLAKGKQEAIEYYNDTYIANGKQLFGDKYIAKEDYLDMNTVVGYEVSDGGVMLITYDGNGYFIEK